METNSTGGQGTRRAVAPSYDDDDDDDDDDSPYFTATVKMLRERQVLLHRMLGLGISHELCYLYFHKAVQEDSIFFNGRLSARAVCLCCVFAYICRCARVRV